MKAVFSLLIIGVLVLGLMASPLAFASHHMVKSPRQQMDEGVAPEDVVCKSGLALMVRDTGRAMCVKPSTAETLVERGYGMIAKEAMMMDEHMESEEMMEEKMTMEEEHMESEMTEKEEMKMKSIGGIDISMAAPIEGSPDAPITIIEFGDFQCPKCNQWFENERDTILKNFVEPGIAKIYFLDFTFLGDDSISAAKAAYCAEEQDMYWEYHTKLYNNQGNIQGGWASIENLKEFAAEIELDTEEFDDCLDSGNHADRISHNTSVGASHGVEGTPTFFIIGADGLVETISGPQPASVFESVIDDMTKDSI